MLPATAEPVNGFPGYFVTPEGQVWSRRRNDGSKDVAAAHVLKGSLSHGYPRVTLIAAGRRRRFFVHRIVAVTFLGQCPDEMEVAHLNGNRGDSRLINLRYVTRSENHLHKIDHGTMPMGDSHPNRSISETTARQIGERLREVRSCSQVAKEFGTSRNVASHIASGRTWRHVFPKDWRPPARRRLTGEQRAAIIELAATGGRQTDIAERFGITQSAVSHLLKNAQHGAHPMAKNFVQPGKTITLTAPYAVTSGDGLLVGSIFGVASGTAAFAEAVETALVGVYDLKKIASQAWAAGDKIYWDNTARQTTKTLTANTLIGVATEAVAGGATDLIGRVRLNGAF